MKLIYYNIKFDICFIFLITFFFFFTENNLINKSNNDTILIFSQNKTEKKIIRNNQIKLHDKKLKLKLKKCYNYTPKIDKNESNNKVKALIIPSSGIYNSGKIIDKVFNKVNWDNFETVILLSISYKNQKNWQMPKLISNYSVSSNERDLSINKDKKGKVIISSLDIEFNNLENKEYNNQNLSTRDLLNEGIEIFNKENSWQAILPFLINLKKKIKFIPLIIGSYNIDLKNKILKYIENNPKTLLVVNNDLFHCGLFYSLKCPLANSRKEFNNSTIENIRLSIDNADNINSKEADQIKMSSYKGVYLFSKLCNSLGLKSGEYFYSLNDKKNKRVLGYLSMIIVK